MMLDAHVFRVPCSVRVRVCARLFWVPRILAGLRYRSRRDERAVKANMRRTRALHAGCELLVLDDFSCAAEVQQATRSDTSED